MNTGVCQYLPRYSAGAVSVVNSRATCTHILTTFSSRFGKFNLLEFDTIFLFLLKVIFIQLGFCIALEIFYVCRHMTSFFILSSDIFRKMEFAKPGDLVLSSEVYSHVVNGKVRSEVCDHCLIRPGIYSEIQPVSILRRCSSCQVLYISSARYDIKKISLVQIVGFYFMFM